MLCFAKKNTGKMLKTRGKHSQFCLSQSVATLDEDYFKDILVLKKFLGPRKIHTLIRAEQLIFSLRCLSVWLSAWLWTVFFPISKISSEFKNSNYMKIPPTRSILGSTSRELWTKLPHFNIILSPSIYPSIYVSL